MPLCQVLCIHRGRSPSGGVVDGFTSWRKAARIGAKAKAEQAQEKKLWHVVAHWEELSPGPGADQQAPGARAPASRSFQGRSIPAAFFLFMKDSDSSNSCRENFDLKFAKGVLGHLLCLGSGHFFSADSIGVESQ